MRFALTVVTIVRVVAMHHNTEAKWITSDKCGGCVPSVGNHSFELRFFAILRVL